MVRLPSLLSNMTWRFLLAGKRYSRVRNVTFSLDSTMSFKAAFGRSESGSFLNRRHRMRHHRLSLAAMLLAGLISFPAPAQQTVTQSYRGVVTHVVGEQPDSVQVGEAVTVSYTVDTTASDVDPSPQAGIYPAGLLSLTVMLPDSDFAVSSGVGQIQTFDNTENPDDQISFYSSSIVSSDDLQGLPVRALELVFSGSTNMFASDAVPTHRLDAHDNVVHITTDRGS